MYDVHSGCAFQSSSLKISSGLSGIKDNNEKEKYQNRVSIIQLLYFSASHSGV